MSSLFADVLSSPQESSEVYSAVTHPSGSAHTAPGGVVLGLWVPASALQPGSIIEAEGWYGTTGGFTPVTLRLGGRGAGGVSLMTMTPAVSSQGHFIFRSVAMLHSLAGTAARFSTTGEIIMPAGDVTPTAAVRSTLLQPANWVAITDDEPASGSPWYNASITVIGSQDVRYWASEARSN